MRKVFFLILMVCLNSNPLFSAEKMRIAIMDIEGKGVSQDIAVAVSDLIRAEIVSAKKFAVVEREQINLILKEQGFQQSGCTDQSCAVKIGRLLSVHKIISDFRQCNSDCHGSRIFPTFSASG